MPRNTLNRRSSRRNSARKNRFISKRLQGDSRLRRLRHEQLEDRRLLSVDFTDFGDATELNLVGDAAIASDVLRLTSGTSDTGGAWYKIPQMASLDFDTTFEFRLTNPSAGLAFVIQNNHETSLGSYGANMGYGWMPNSLAIEFDSASSFGSIWNEYAGDPAEDHISIHTRGPLANSMHEVCSLGSYSFSSLQLDDGQVHTARIQYQPGTL